MIIEEQELDRTTDLITFFRENGATTEVNGFTYLPKKLGKGFVYQLFSAPGVMMMIQQFELKQSFQINRGSEEDNDFLIFSFRNVAGQPESDASFDPEYMPAVQISTNDISLDILVPAHFSINNIIIGMEKRFLRNFIPDSTGNKVSEMLTTKKQSYLYEEFIQPKILKVAAEIFEMDPDEVLSTYFYRIKAEEMVYLFLAGLLKNRKEIPDYPFNRQDVQTIYHIREVLIKDLSDPPQLSALATIGNMSVSKLGKLFRQIFGESIYNYFQKIRIQKAAYLLREEKLSVSEVGYRLGFSNLSHFARLFEKHIGMKPKHYSKG